MHSNERLNQHLEIIELIAKASKDWSDFLRSERERFENNASAQAKVKAGKAALDWKFRCEDVFRDLVKDYSKSMYFGNSGQGYYPFDKRLDFRSETHPLRQIQERYLIISLGIEVCGTSIENWRSIGLALANEKTDVVAIMNPPPKAEKRGRRRGGLSLDYERAVWKVSVDEQMMLAAEPLDEGFLAETYPEEEFFKVTKYSLSEVLDAYLWAFENPDLHPHLNLFRYLEGKLKLRHKSRASLLVGFNRGEKQREELWND